MSQFKATINAPNSISTGLTQTSRPGEKLTELPRTPYWIQGATSKGKGMGEGDVSEEN